MEKSTKAEMIAALVTDKYSGFKMEDTSMLEACSDIRLEEFRAASDDRKSSERKVADIQSRLTNAEALLKVTEERLRTAQEGPTEEEWMAKAPPSVKKLIDAQKAEEDATRNDLVSKLKDRGQNTETELKAMSLDTLKQLAAYAQVPIPDFSGRGLPQERNAQARSYAPPDPYAEALKSKTVN